MVRIGGHSRLVVTVLLLCLITAGMVAAQPAFRPSFLPTITVPRLTQTIRIDGDLDDPGWRAAAVAARFVEISPGDLIEPPVKSEARLTYDQHNLYVAMIAWDDPGTLRVSVADRDQIFKDDYAGIMVDTYGDLSWAYELFVNPIGVQGDLRLLSSGEEDLSFDIVWESRGKVTDSGYQVEIAIPFSSLRFPEKPQQIWRINFWRDRQRDVRNRYSWAAISRDDPCTMCQWGTATGIEGIMPGSTLELMPNVIAYQSGSRDFGRFPPEDFANEDPNVEFAFNARYGLTSDASVEAAINPDFSQVESDPDEIDVNAPFALFFEERRPFFQEGSDLYNTWIDAIYTRSINSPQAAVKLTGRFGRSSIAYLLARDENSPFILPSRERSFTFLLDESVVNIARAKTTLGESSYLGGALTDRRLDGGGSGTVFGFDGSIRLTRNYRFEFQVLGSRTVEPDTAVGLDSLTFDSERYTYDLDGERFSGHAIFSRFQRSARHWNFNLDYWGYSPTFRADNGFVTRTNLRQAEFWTGIMLQPNRKLLKQWEISIELAHVWDFNGPVDEFKDQWVRPSLYFELPGQTEVNLEYINSREVFRDQVFEGISVGEIFIASRFSEVLGGEMEFSTGRTIWRTFSETPVLGYGKEFFCELEIKPASRLIISPSFNYSRLDYQGSYLQGHPTAEKNIFDGYILRTRVNYQFTREWYLRLVVQYNEFSKAVSVEPLLTYRLNPFTIFYVGATSEYQRWEIDDATGLSDSRWDLASRQFFAKFQYLFRI